MTKYKPYSTYKPSGVEWLGDVPEHWRTWKVSHAFGQIGSGTTPDTKKLYFYGGDIPWVTTSELRENVITDTSEKLTEDALREHSALSLYPPGTLLIAMYGATIGRLGILGITACTNQACCALAKPRELDVKFCFYWLWMRRNEIILLSSGGGQPNINQQKIYSIRIPAPPLQEQRVIANFLDRETTRIDTLITKKREMIDLLEKKRAAIVTEAVTKGCDRDVPLRDSGIFWLDKIPEHWQVRQLKYLCILQRGFDLPSEQREEGSFPIYGGGGITGYHTVAMVQPPGVVTGRYGTIGQVYFVEEPFWPLNTSLYVKEFWGNSPSFIRHMLSILPMEIYAGKSAVPGVDRNDLHAIPVPVPPREEQNLIVKYLNHATKHQQRVIEIIEDQIKEIQKHRQALITAAVTGKIDVREEIGSDRGVA